jgi:hypothetical protein
MRAGSQHLCLHGAGGVGKTTALQEIAERLPAGSLMITYDCYGGGRYLDPSALRHRPIDAFLQLTNELATKLKLPLLLSRHPGSDYPRLFAKRLKHAADALQVAEPAALLVIAVDAADNAVTAAESRVPVERAFVHDFVLLEDLPTNVRFIVTARTGRLTQLRLPPHYYTEEIGPFTRAETGENVTRLWNAPEQWVDDFHHLSGGIPRVQTYAFQGEQAHPSEALDQLRPAGKSLDDVFREQFRHALTKSGTPAEVARLCAGLAVLPRPVPLSDLAAVLEATEPLLADVCADLAPGIRTHESTVSFADEDFEHFVRQEGVEHLAAVQAAAATWLLSRADKDRYAALNVAAALFASGRATDLLQLVEREPAPAVVTDPVLRREAELQRLRLAIKVCREAGDAARALRFVLIGAEGVKTEVALRDLLTNNPDLTIRFARETAGRLILSDGDLIAHHGPLLFQKLAADAQAGDPISVREGRRLLGAWMQARSDQHRGKEDVDYRRAWQISISDIESQIEAALRLDGVDAALKALGSWRPRRITLKVALSLPARLVAQGDTHLLLPLLSATGLGPMGKLLVMLPVALAGQSVDAQLLESGLRALTSYPLGIASFFDHYRDAPSAHSRLLDSVLTACELLTNHGAADALVEATLDRFLASEFRRIDRRYEYEADKLDLLFRAYTLKEARSRRSADPAAVFEPRPQPKDEKHRPKSDYREEEHDRALMETTRAVFDVYRTVAEALVGRPAAAQLGASLRAATEKLKQNDWRFSYRPRSGAIRAPAARAVLVLLAAGYDATTLRDFAKDIYGRWGRGNEMPDPELVARLSLREEVHSDLIADLGATAAKTRTMRIGADEKAKALVGLARYLLPLSPADANAVFNDAVEAASELDHEAMAQIRLFDRLVRRGEGKFSHPRETAREISEILADAAIRLDGYENFPWQAGMSGLARLDCALALANAARWDDETVATLTETLPPLLKTGLETGTITPGQAAALDLFLHYDNGVTEAALTASVRDAVGNPEQLAEEAAYDVLVRRGQRAAAPLVGFIKEKNLGERWATALLNQESFLSTQPPSPSERGHPRRGSGVDRDASPDPIAGFTWTESALIEASSFRDAVKHLKELARASETYIPTIEILRRARAAVAPRHRVAHLTVLGACEGVTITNDAVQALLDAIDHWGDSPAVKTWCRTNLPSVIETRLPEFARYLHHGEETLPKALRLTGLTGSEVRELVLRGIEKHVDSFGADSIFALIGLIGEELDPTDAAELTQWYATRLASRVGEEDRDQVAPEESLPKGASEAVARFIFAYLGDFDLRMRWRAAHAVRRLARLDDQPPLLALISEYGRKDESTFRGRGLPFYWLAARLWFVIAWDRVSLEKPQLGGSAGELLLRVALDDDFPHPLVRGFAKTACEKLLAAGVVSLTTEQVAALRAVNETPLPRQKSTGQVARHLPESDEGRRFKFDWMDTLPYWYRPMLSSFANVDGERFLREVERWIVDVWGYSGDVRDFDKERRRGRFEDRNWTLSSNRHGTNPTLERLNNHLEWHGMWCAAGELLKTEPLIGRDDDEWDSWDNLEARIRREMLSEPPLWAADLRVPTPLNASNWVKSSEEREDWADGVTEAYHRTEFLIPDAPDYLVVDGDVERWSTDRYETTSVSSALVEPRTASALLRALQTMEDAWDYKLPDEGEDHEVDEAPYRLIGWLRRLHGDPGIDDDDPFRGYAFRIKMSPGSRVVSTMGLTRDAAWLPRWGRDPADPPMFVYEAWGERDKDDDHYGSYFRPAGSRLLAHKSQLQEFLRTLGLDLVLEVEVSRRGRETRGYVGPEEGKKEVEGRYDRLYRLQSGGALEIAEGCVGTWTGDRRTA